MALACGCEIRGGEPVSLDTIRAHYKHTFEALLFWELLRRPEKPDHELKMKLSQARIDLIEAIDKLYPEVSEGGG
ncbi:unnamed protein product [marine sediment metagenome]|uniref:Uncharacterized protein n=1 Tax=marine sediment metagenome TaxID=412755 RepID=X1UCC1_9ZZZZ